MAAVQAAGGRKQLQRSGSAASEGAGVGQASKRQKRADGRRANAAGALRVLDSFDLF